MAWLISASLFLGAALVLLGNAWQREQRARQVNRRLLGQTGNQSRLGYWVLGLGQSRLGQRIASLDNETQGLLLTLGWRRASLRSLYAASQVGLPLLGLGVALVLQWLFFPQAKTPWIAPFAGLCIGYLLPKRLLAAAVQRRKKSIAREVSTFIPLLRIFFESGMAVEQTLRVLSNEARQLSPELTRELRLVMVRVDSGLDLGTELAQISSVLAVEEFSETCVVLRQMVHQGGGAMKSLLALKQRLDERRLTQLEEYVSKMSAKMSVVMMLFLFPGLLIVVGGPGLTAIARAFTSS